MPLIEGSYGGVQGGWDPGASSSSASSGSGQYRFKDGKWYVYSGGKWVPSASGPPNQTGSSSNSDKDSNANRNAYEYLKRTFESWGLGTLAPKILEMVQQGYDADTVMLMLQDTDEYKKRFAGNEARRKAGLAVLSPAEYLSLERSYRQILESNGMPAGFYDSLDDFTSWIGQDVSPAEIQDRVQLAARAVSNTDTGYLESLREYGLGQGDLVAAMLDRSRALPILQKRVREAEIGAEARRQGLRLSQARADYFESMGVDRSQAASAYQMIGSALPTLENLGDIYDDSTYGQADLEDELLGRSGMASERRRRLQSRETGSFSGESGLNRSSLGVGTRGSF
ncbi:hypothetical protein AB0C33_01900 [Nonomuraea sp. NPDC048881]|uniref:hypothetical protein n=1 Tax=Nonomuraea sp. NPDC048881 TaxID=3155030 RepID=UPI0033CEE880